MAAWFGRVGVRSRIAPALALAAALVAAAGARAQGTGIDPEVPEDMLGGATRCAAFWFAWHTVMVARRPVAEGTDFEAYDAELGYYPDMGHMYRNGALELADGDLDRVDYMIALEVAHLFRMLSDAHAEVPRTEAMALAEREERFCNAVGMMLPPPWRMH